MKISDFTYPLPDEKIAKYPASPRDESKLLVFENSEVKHSVFKEIVDFLPKNAHLVLNDTKVIPARLFFQRKTGANIEIFLLNPISPSEVLPLVMEEMQTATWHCVIGNKRRWKQSEILESAFVFEGKEEKITAELSDVNENLVKIEWTGGIPFFQVVQAYGNIPLPPYLNRNSEDSDKIDYQTIYSENEGAVAAPTAGLHFTESIFEALEKKGISKSFVTLHVGAGTFMPVKTENALEHPMHSEQIIVNSDFISRILENSEFIVPVGTTSMRTLESLYWIGVKMILGIENPFFIEKMFPYQSHPEISLQQSFKAISEYLSDKDYLVANTEIMIFPAYKFKVCKALITNFHQPASTLLLLVAAFIGENNWKIIYNEALENNYRFLSFGDSSLLIP